MVDDLETPAPTAEEIAEAEAKAKAEAEQDPLKTELERVEKGKRTKKEKLLYTRKRIDEQLKAEGVNPEDLEEIEDDEQPLTKGEFKKHQQEVAVKTALDIADDIENETERELVKYHIQNTIRSTGNPKEDLRLARALANDVKNKQILEHISGKPTVKRGSGQGGGSPEVKEEVELTAEERAFMQPPFNLSKEAILKARSQAKPKE